MKQTNTGAVLTGKLQPSISQLTHLSIFCCKNQDAYQNHLWSIFNQVTQFLRTQNLEGGAGRWTENSPCGSKCLSPLPWLRTTTVLVQLPNICTLVLKYISLYKSSFLKCLSHYNNLIIPTPGPWILHRLVFRKIVVRANIFDT